MSIALVTGGNRGLGLATATLLAEQGMHVIIGARQQADADAAAAQLRSAGHKAHGVQLDVAVLDSIAAAAKQVGDGGGLDVLVNNAGVLPEATATGESQFADVALFRQTFETNVFGAVAVTEAFLPMLRASAAGRIVNVSTTMGSLTEQTNPDSPYYQMVVPAYQASKAALNSVTIGLSKKLVDTAVTAVAVCPGFVQTDLTPINRDQAPLTAEHAAVVVAAAAHGTDTGTFVDSSGPVAW